MIMNWPVLHPLSKPIFYTSSDIIGFYNYSIISTLKYYIYIQLYFSVKYMKLTLALSLFKYTKNFFETCKCPFLKFLHVNISHLSN